MTAAIGAGLAVGWLLAVGCVVDKLLEHIPAVERYISSLPLGAPSGTPARWGEEEQRNGRALAATAGAREVELVTTSWGGHMESVNERIKRCKRRARRRQMLRRLAVCAVLAGLAVTSSWNMGAPRGTPVARGEEEPRAARGLPLAADRDPAQASDDEDKPERPSRRLPDRTALAWMVRRSWFSPGDGRAFAKQYPELSDLFLSASSGPAPWEETP